MEITNFFVATLRIKLNVKLCCFLHKTAHGGVFIGQHVHKFRVGGGEQGYVQTKHFYFPVC